MYICVIIAWEERSGHTYVNTWYKHVPEIACGNFCQYLGMLRVLRLLCGLNRLCEMYVTCMFRTCCEARVADARIYGRLMSAVLYVVGGMCGEAVRPSVSTVCRKHTPAGFWP